MRIHKLEPPEARALLMRREVSEGIAFQVAALQAQRGWSDGDLCDKASLTMHTLRRIKSGRYNGSIAPLSRIASAFDVGLIVRFEAWSAYLDRRGAWVVPKSFVEEQED